MVRRYLNVMKIMSQLKNIFLVLKIGFLVFLFFLMGGWNITWAWNQWFC